MPSHDLDGLSGTSGVRDAGLLSPVWVDSAAEAATGDAAFVRHMLDAEAALTRSQARVGLAPASAAAAVTAAAGQGRFYVRGLALRARQCGNPVIPLVADLTATVAGYDPASAAYVHRGATSQDIWDTAVMLTARRALEPAIAALDRAIDAVTALASGHRDTPMAGRTLTQHAVPTTFGLKTAGWRHLLIAARERLAAARAALPVQLGGAAGTLAAFHEFGPPGDPGIGTRLLAAYADETGLAEPLLPWHTLRVPVADLAGALAFTTGALGKLAADVLVLSRTEVGEVSEAEGGGSSAMAHKSNPVRAVLVAAAARQTPALAAILYQSLAAEDERPAGAWHAEWQPLREALRLAGGAAEAAAEMAAGLRPDPARMRANLDMTCGLPATERLTVALSALIGRDEATGALTRAARAVRQGGGADLAGTLAGDPAVPLPEQSLRGLSDPAGYLGSAGPLVDRALLEET